MRGFWYAEGSSDQSCTFAPSLSRYTLLQARVASTRYQTRHTSVSSSSYSPYTPNLINYVNRAALSITAQRNYYNKNILNSFWIWTVGASQNLKFGWTQFPTEPLFLNFWFRPCSFKSFSVAYTLSQVESHYTGIDRRGLFQSVSENVDYTPF